LQDPLRAPPIRRRCRRRKNRPAALRHVAPAAGGAGWTLRAN